MKLIGKIYKMEEEYSFGSWIRRRRRALDLTQRELAHRVNCSLSTIVKIERDLRRPSRQIAMLLAKHLSIPKEHLELFIKVARGIKSVNEMSPLPNYAEPHIIRTIRKTTHLLPMPPTPLVGRKKELAEIIHLLNLPECRLVTIIGLGGIGKTRIALQVAHDLQAASPSIFPDGLFFVPLAHIMAVETIPKAVTQSIGFDLSGPLKPEDQLLNFLRKKILLLILDNTEHLLDGASFFARMLERAPGVKLLVTSRERLNLRSEWVFALQGLPVPPSDSDEEIERYSAARLFVNRARQIQHDFMLHERDRANVANICRKLYGIPLGIELAASWVRTLPLGEIVTEISHDLDFLSTSARDIPERHRSLRVVFDHSWSLLSEDEQRTLRQLSIFRGGFYREAAQEVAKTDITTLDVLIDKAVLRRNASARYYLHELIQRYAASRLAEDPEEENATRERYSKFFLSLMGNAIDDLHSSHQKETLAWMSSELANIRSSWTWAIDNNQVELLRKAAKSLWYFYELCYYYREAEAVFGQAAEMAQRHIENQGPDITESVRKEYADALGQFLMYQAYFVMRLGKIDEANALCQTSISRLRSVHNPEALGHALTYYAVLNWTIGKLDSAWKLLQESLPLSREHGPPWQIALFTGIFGNVAYERGEYDNSFQLLTEALERAQTIGDPRLIVFISAYLGRTAQKLRKIGDIEGLLWEGAQIAQDSGDRFGYSLILEQLALAAQHRSDFSTSEQLFEASIELLEEIGDLWYLSRILNSLGGYKYSVGKISEASENFKQAIRLSLESRALLITLNALIGLADIYEHQGNQEASLETVIFVMDNPACPEYTRIRAEEIYNSLESLFSSETIEAIHRRTHSETLEEFARSHL